jgi:uncharacterized protein YbaR (Trm112 family)
VNAEHSIKAVPGAGPRSNMHIDQILNRLRCPENHAPLRRADPALVARINQAIAAGGVKTRAGEPMTVPIEGGFVREDGAVLYPIIDRIPILLVEDSIPLEQAR